MNEFWATIVSGILCFLIGGIIGVIFFTGWFPAAWIGLAIGIGVVVCPHIWMHLDD